MNRIPQELMSMTNEQSRELLRLARLDELNQMAEAITLPDPDALTPDQIHLVSLVAEQMLEYINERKKALRSQPHTLT